MSRSRQRCLALAAACMMLTLGGCGDYFARRDMESTLAAWIGDSPTTERIYGKPVAYATVKRDEIDKDSPLAELVDGTVARLNQSGIGYATEVSGEMFDLIAANDRRMIFRRRSDRLTVRIDLKPKDATDSIEIAVTTLELRD